MTTYPIHPAAAIFPMMNEQELAELAKDIKENGQIEPVILYEGAVLDGRNRLAACGLAEVEPTVMEHGPLASPVVFVLSRNLHRRHLTTSQRAAIAAETMPMLMEEAKKRQGFRSDLTSVSSDTEVGYGNSRAIAAKAAQVSEASVQRAWKVKQTDPETFEHVKAGEITVNAAADGHTEQPKRGGQLPKDATTARGQQRAEAHKRRLIAILNGISGACAGLPTLDVDMLRGSCSEEEAAPWVQSAMESVKTIRNFVNQLKGVNGQ